jgi:hypothetical protein
VQVTAVRRTSTDSELKPLSTRVGGWFYLVPI